MATASEARDGVPCRSERHERWKEQSVDAQRIRGDGSMAIFGAVFIGLLVIIPTGIVEGLAALKERKREKIEWQYYYNKYYRHD